jgi:hypothetical protein
LPLRASKGIVPLFRGKVKFPGKGKGCLKNREFSENAEINMAGILGISFLQVFFSPFLPLPIECWDVNRKWWPWPCVEVGGKVLTVVHLINKFILSCMRYLKQVA